MRSKFRAASSENREAEMAGHLHGPVPPHALKERGGFLLAMIVAFLLDALFVAAWTIISWVLHFALEWFGHTSSLGAILETFFKCVTFLIVVGYIVADLIRTYRKIYVKVRDEFNEGSGVLPSGGLPESGPAADRTLFKKSNINIR